jgi:Fe-S-cluster-containing dehydrogenase component
MSRREKRETRRRFLREVGGAIGLLAVWRAGAATIASSSGNGTSGSSAERTPEYAMLMDLERCIGCGQCVAACKTENDVPDEPTMFRTWVERYIIKNDHTVRVDSPNGGKNGFADDVPEREIFRSFFVPKTCNHCSRPPCVQVCPVGATFRTPEGAVIVDRKYCVGCRYCIQACPYGARYFHPDYHTPDKCTFCYHRVTRGLRPACVEACPRQVRIFGDLHDPKSKLVKLLHKHPVQVLKPTLNTEPRVYYLNLDKEVR